MGLGSVRRPRCEGVPPEIFFEFLHANLCILVIHFHIPNVLAKKFRGGERYSHPIIFMEGQSPPPRDRFLMTVYRQRCICVPASQVDKLLNK